MTHKPAYLAVFALTLSISHCPHTLLAQAASPAPASVSGSWKVSLHGQHIIPVGMELKQDGRKVTGTLMLWNGDVVLDGELVDGAMKVSGRLEPTDGTPAGDRIVVGDPAAQRHARRHIRLASMDRSSSPPSASPIDLRDAAPPHRLTTPAPTPASIADPAPFAGNWKLMVGDGASARPMDLELVVQGTAITGILKSDHAGPLPIQNGRFADGKVMFGVTMGADVIVHFTATLKGHGALSGNISGPMGAMAFTGERAR